MDIQRSPPPCGNDGGADGASSSEWEDVAASLLGGSRGGPVRARVEKQDPKAWERQPIVEIAIHAPERHTLVERVTALTN